MIRIGRLNRLVLVLMLTAMPAACKSNPYREHPLLAPKVDESLHRVAPFNPDISGKRVGPPPKTDEKARFERIMSEPPVKKSFRFSLAEVRRSTLQNNFDLAAAFFNPAIAATQIDVERARFEATFNFAASRSRTVGPEYTPNSAELTDTSLDQASLTPTLNIPLITGGTVSLGPVFGSSDYSSTVGESRFWQASAEVQYTQPLLRNAGSAYNEGFILLAEYQERMDAANTKLAVINTLLNAEQTYWNVYFAWQALKIQREQYELYRKELSDTLKLEQNGVRTMADVYGFETGLATQVSQVVQADNDLRRAIRELKVLMHDPSLSLDYTVGIEPVTKPSLVRYRFDPEAMVKMALENRMELMEMELRIASDALGIRLAENQTLPQLDLNLSSNWNGFSSTGYANATERLFHNSDGLGWNMGITASIPLGNRAAKAQLREAVLKRLQNIANRNQRKMTIMKDVYGAIDSLNTAWLELLATRYRVQAAKNSFMAEKKLFSLGNRTSTDVSDALLSLGIARVAEARSETNYQIWMARLAAATGTLLGYSKVEWNSGDVMEK